MDKKAINLDTLRTTIAADIRRIRTSRGMTLRQFCEEYEGKTGDSMSLSNLSKYERNLVTVAGEIYLAIKTMEEQDA